MDSDGCGGKLQLSCTSGLLMAGSVCLWLTALLGAFGSETNVPSSPSLPAWAWSNDNKTLAQGLSQRWRCNSSLIWLVQHPCSCWCRFMGCVRQFSLAIGHENSRISTWGGNVSSGAACGVCWEGAVPQGGTRGGLWLWDGIVAWHLRWKWSQHWVNQQVVEKNPCISLGWSDGWNEVSSQEFCKHWLL